MQIEIIKPGLQTTIQDSGRTGWMHYGFSRCGPMDSLAARLANMLVGQEANHPFLEFTLTGPEIRFEGEFQIALTGADCSFTLNDKPVANYKTITVKAGDILVFKAMHSGCRGYIGIRQKLEVSEYLGSVATHLPPGVGGYQGRMLKAGDKLDFLSAEAIKQTIVDAQHRPQYSGNYRIRVTEAPETALFSEEDRARFTDEAFQVMAESNRMGVRLASENTTDINLAGFRSRGLVSGAIQMPPDGQPIIAGVDAQTIGGYPRIAQVIQADLPVIGQLRPNDSLQFQWLTIEAARQIHEAQNKQLLVAEVS